MNKDLQAEAIEKMLNDRMSMLYLDNHQRKIYKAGFIFGLASHSSTIDLNESELRAEFLKKFRNDSKCFIYANIIEVFDWFRPCISVELQKENENLKKEIKLCVSDYSKKLFTQTLEIGRLKKENDELQFQIKRLQATVKLNYDCAVDLENQLNLLKKKL